MKDLTVKTKTNGSQKLGSLSAADIYREAALKVERGEREFSCVAIDWTVRPGNLKPGWCRETIAYRRMFSEYGDDYLSTTQFRREENPVGLRVLALCFMAAIADSERPACSKRAGARRKAR